VRSGITTGELIIENAISRENISYVLEIEPDGRFHGTIPLIYPIKSGILLGNLLMSYYLEPGQTLAMIVDWEDMLVTYRKEISPKIKAIEYKGPTAGISSELNKYELKKMDYEQMKSKSINAFKTEELSVMNENLSDLSKLEQTGTFLPKTIDLLKNEAIISSAHELMQYGDQKSTNSTTGQRIKNALPSDYYDFLKDVPLDNPKLMSYEQYYYFVNYLNNLLFLVRSEDQSNLSFNLNFYKYLQKDKKVVLTKKENELRIYAETGEIPGNVDDKNIQKQALDASRISFFKKYAKEFEDYLNNCQILQNRFMVDEFLTDWKVKDSFWTDSLKLKPNLTYEAVKMQSISVMHIFNDKMEKETTRYYLDSLSKDIKHPFLIEEIKRYFDDYYKKLDKGTYTLTEGKATEILKKIIDPFKGKMLFVDFWSITCGPCIQAINDMKSVRDKNRTNEKFAFIFITDEAGSPTKEYERFVKDQNMVNTYRISNADFTYIQQFFRFNAVPHYMLIDPKGNIMDDDFNMFKSNAELKKLLKEN